MPSNLGKAKKTRGKSPHTNKHRVPYKSMVSEVVKESDIIIQVLDARFIEKSRNLEVENSIKNSNKILIYVFNKSDLIDRVKIVREKELQEFKPSLFFSVKERRGSATLKKLIKMNAKRIKKDSVNIGVIGYPNVGKSSIINYLTGRSGAGTSPEAGHTKGIQKIKLSEGLYLIDTPGVIPLTKDNREELKMKKHSRIGAATWSKVKHPEIIVNRIFLENPGVLENYYEFKGEKDIDSLIEFVGKKSNFFKKGGEVEEVKTAKKILEDWQEGKIDN